MLVTGLLLCYIGSWALTTATPPRRRAFIAYRDAHFEGEDAVLAAELARRCGGTALDEGPPDKARLEDIKMELNIKEDWNSMIGLDKIWEDSKLDTRRDISGEKSNSMEDQSPEQIMPRRRAETTTPAESSEPPPPESGPSKKYGDSMEWWWATTVAPGRYSTHPADANDSRVEEYTMTLMEQSCYTIQYRLKDIEYIIKKYEGNPRYRLAFAFRKIEDWDRDLNTMYSYLRRHHELGAAISDPDWYQFDTLIKYAVYYSHAVRKFFNIIYTRKYIVNLNELINRKDQEEKLRKEIEAYKKSQGNITTPNQIGWSSTPGSTVSSTTLPGPPHGRRRFRGYY